MGFRRGCAPQRWVQGPLAVAEFLVGVLRLDKVRQKSGKSGYVERLLKDLRAFLTKGRDHIGVDEIARHEYESRGRFGRDGADAFKNLCLGHD